MSAKVCPRCGRKKSGKKRSFNYERAIRLLAKHNYHGGQKVVAEQMGISAATLNAMIKRNIKAEA